MRHPAASARPCGGPSACIDVNTCPDVKNADLEDVAA